MQPKHTPTPWFIKNILAGLPRLVHGEPNERGFRDDVPVFPQSWRETYFETAQANFEFIVLAVNSYYIDQAIIKNLTIEVANRAHFEKCFQDQLAQAKQDAEDNYEQGYRLGLDDAVREIDTFGLTIYEAVQEGMTYAEKLKDPRWQKKRLEIMQRDGFKCCHCLSDTETLHVHHSYYEKGRDPWDYPDGSLKTLCHECHHDMGNALEEFSKAFAKLDLSTFELGCLADAINECEGGLGGLGNMKGPALAEFFKNPDFQAKVVALFLEDFYRKYPELKD